MNVYIYKKVRSGSKYRMEQTESFPTPPPKKVYPHAHQRQKKKASHCACESCVRSFLIVGPELPGLQQDPFPTSFHEYPKNLEWLQHLQRDCT